MIDGIVTFIFFFVFGGLCLFAGYNAGKAKAYYKWNGLFLDLCQRVIHLIEELNEKHNSK